ncbi:hypothetical protein BJV77DRAFT_684089 [Russula vinacea]|nr:hypothetical protein BJV77DRAFT_684089 [Russula vinacea]
MEEIILVTGCDRTRSWTNVAFLGDQLDSQVSFGVKVEGSDTNVKFQSSRGNTRGAVLRHGPEGANLPENQCVFIRGYRVARTFWILPRRLRAAAGPSPDPGGYDYDPDREVISVPAMTEYHDPLHLLIEYIAERASDCDMVLAHDDDLKMIDGLGHDTSLETLEPDVMIELLQRSNIKIDKVSWDLSQSDDGPSTDTSVVKVAMLSMTLQNWDTASSPQWSPLSAQNIDLDDASDSGDVPTSSLLGRSPVPPIQGDAISAKPPYQQAMMTVHPYTARFSR